MNQALIPMGKRLRTAIRILRLAMLLPLLLMGLVVWRLNDQHPPKAVPADVCALVPADLLARVVPAAKPGKPSTDGPSLTAATARCSTRTDPDNATSTADADLSIQVDHEGSLGGKDPGAHARDEFAGDKRREITKPLDPGRVFDLPGLGDDAYVFVQRPRNYAVTEHRSSVEVHVLAGATVLRVDYDAAPSTDDLATAAAVALAQALLGAVR
jgi:hypothetical protein